ncbi:DUF1214 domain-containing protein [Nocardia sp. NPDC051981]|uniref:DUF1214 domain-containing protein n=1 Tax=Nocardia sp. NPDC051981 TaxID=3155417 RepID=UPI00341C04BE
MTESSMPTTSSSATPASDAAWAFLLTTLENLSGIVRSDARDSRELLEGHRVLTRVLALCSEMAVDVDPGAPRFFPMTTPLRQVGGPNPDGEYDLCTLVPGRGYRIVGQRGTATYIGFQIMAGTGLTPRRAAGYISDRDLPLDTDGRFELVLATEDPGLPGTWVPIPSDASAIVTRQYIADYSTEQLATYTIETLDAAGPIPELDDATFADQLTALTWTAVKLMTLHRTVAPDLLHRPNELIVAEPESLGSENTTPDNLYMLGMFDLEPDQALQLDITPPDTRYWSVALENIWHECLEPHRRHSSVTNKGVTPRADGTVRLVIAGSDPGVPNWLDTGGRGRGFVLLRWLDHPVAPDVQVRVVPIAEVTA